MLRARSTGCGCVVAALEDDRLRHDTASLVVGAPRKNSSGAASYECILPSCACAAADTACLALRQVGELVWLLNSIISMNSTVMSKDEKSEY
jgi:hypothetical protein